MNVLEIDEALVEGNGLKEFFEKPLVPTFLDSAQSNSLPNGWDLNQISIKDFIEKHERAEPKTKLIAFMQIADKKDASDDRNMPLLKQDNETCISSIFGKEKRANGKELDKAREYFYEELSSIWKSYKTQRNMQKLRKEVYDAFDKLKSALAETRRAANDVSLVDHSCATASIMKALLCGDALEPFQSLLPTYRHWKIKLRVLGIGWNTKKLFAETQSLSGIAGRELLVDRVRKYLENFLEYDIPIGNVIYKDQNTICFLVPENINIIFNDLKEQIIKNVDALTDGSLIPAVELSEFSSPYPNKVITKTIEKLREKNATPIQESLNPTWVNRWSTIASSEICTQCGKRPITRGEELCEFCIELIRKGASDSVKKAIVTPSVYNETVWIDEIADKNGNVALVYGLLSLGKWLDGTLLKSLSIKTLQDIRNVNQKELMEKLTSGKEIREFFEDYDKLSTSIQKFEELLKNNCLEDAAKLLQPFLDPKFRPRTKELLQDTYTGLYSRAEPQTPAGVLEVTMTKPPSPSRIRKIWNETQKFFQGFATITQTSVCSEIGDYCYRLKFKPKFLNKEDEQLLKSIKSPILEVDKFNSEIKLPKSDLFWDGEYAHTTIRLEHYVPSETGKKKLKEAMLKEKQGYIKQIIEQVKASNETFVTLKGKKKQQKISLAIESYSFEKYIPVRTILASPNLFVTLVPAELALNIIQKEYLPKYQECLGKVADRLPLNMGILFFKRKFPLYIAMDVMAKLADNLLSLSSERHIFKVEERSTSELFLEEDNKDKQQLLCTKDKWLVKYKWEIDDKLGDNSKDLYYPNFIVSADKPEIKKKETYFELSNLGSTLNVKDIEAGMSLQMYPSLFDFHFLGATGERFHLFSDNKKRQNPLLGAFGMRPYLLKDIEKMNELWDIISPEKGKLTTAQIKKLEYACITKIEDWFRTGYDLTTNPASDETYRKLVESSITNICKDRLSPDKRNRLMEAVLSGMFFDVVELFLTLKSYNKEAEKNERNI
jgi:CRISPR-associated Csx11 family protein